MDRSTDELALYTHYTSVLKTELVQRIFIDGDMQIVSLTPFNEPKISICGTLFCVRILPVLSTARKASCLCLPYIVMAVAVLQFLAKYLWVFGVLLWRINTLSLSLLTAVID